MKAIAGVTSLGLVVGGLLAIAPSAMATTNLECSMIPPVAERCDLDAAGQAASFSSAVWTVYGATRTGATITFTCPYGTGYNEVDVTVDYLNAAGQSQEESGTFACIRSR